MQPKYPDIVVPLIGGDDNAFAFLGRVRRAMKHAGVPNDDIERFLTEAMAGDYDHLLKTVMRWVTVSDAEEE